MQPVTYHQRERCFAPYMQPQLIIARIISIFMEGTMATILNIFLSMTSISFHCLLLPGRVPMLEVTKMAVVDTNVSVCFQTRCSLSVGNTKIPLIAYLS